MAAAALVIAAHLALLISFRTKIPPIIQAPTVGQSGESVEIVALASLSKPASPPEGVVAPAVTAPPPKTDEATPELIEHPETLGLPPPSADLEPVPVDGAPAPRPQAAMSGSTPDDPCHFAQALQGALQGDETVRLALAKIPRTSRSVANAIMVWNGQWVPIDAVGGDASLAPVRVAIVRSLSATPAGCLTRTNSGPLFIAIPGWPETTVLALGSGQWRASDLVAEGTDLASSPPPPRLENLWRLIWPG